MSQDLLPAVAIGNDGDSALPVRLKQANLIAEVCGVPERWNLFLSPPQLVSREDVPIGYNPIFEYAALPDVERVIEAIRVVME